MRINYLFCVLFSSLFFHACSDQDARPKVEIQYIQDTLKSGTPAPTLVKLPLGKGIIGGQNFRSFQNEAPIYEVSIQRPIAIGISEVTFADYDLYCQSSGLKCPNDEGWGRGEQPVVNVSWREAEAYTLWLSEQTGQAYRLASEAEWEYAARAGTDSKFWWGEDYQQGLDHCDRDMGGCPQGTEVGHPVPAGLFSRNPFGLWNMTSNVSEWVLDCANPDHTGAKLDGSARLDGDCNSRMVKGSNWRSPQPFVHLSKRMALEKGERSKQIGFRVVREL